MSQHGLLIDYEFCTGCHACEVACKVEKGLEGRGVRHQAGRDRAVEAGRRRVGMGLPSHADAALRFVPGPHRRRQGSGLRASLPGRLAMEFGPVESLPRRSSSPAWCCIRSSRRIRLCRGAQARRGKGTTSQWRKGASMSEKAAALGDKLVGAVQNNVTQALGLIYGLGMLTWTAFNQMYSNYWSYFLTEICGLEPRSWAR